MKILILIGAILFLSKLVSSRKINAIIPSVNESFICKANGAFPDAHDPSKFYYCVPNGEGFISTLISCAIGYIFDATSGKCVLAEQNQGRAALFALGNEISQAISLSGSTKASTNSSVTHAAPRNFNCPGLGSFADPTTNLGFYYCISDGDDGYIPIRISCGKGAVYVDQIGSCGIPGDDGSTTQHPGTEGTTVEPEPFVCPGPGSFPNPVDKTKFYYCFSDGDDGYIYIEFTCGKGTEFDPELSGCAAVEETTTTSTTITTTQEPPATTTPDSTTQTTTTSTTEELTTTVEPETTTEPPVEFVCPGEGVFPNPESKNSFYFCFADGEDGYIKILMECAKDQEFDPEELQCMNKEVSTTESPTSSTTSSSSSTSSTSTTNESTTQESSTTLSSTTTTEGSTASSSTTSQSSTTTPDSSTTIAPTTTTDESTEQTTTTTPDESTTAASTTPDSSTTTVTSTTDESTTQESSTTLSSTTTTEGSTASSSTTSQSSTTTPDSSTTIAPTTTTDESTEQTTTTTPDESTTAASTTPDSSTTTVTSTTGSTVSPTTPGVSTTPAAFKCTEQGVFADPTDNTRYYYCSPNGEGGLREILLTCPLGLVFDPVKKYCSKPDQPFITTTTTSTTATTASFACTRAGMFENPKDTKSFYVCIFDGFGYISVLMECSAGLVFIQDLYRCASPDTTRPPPAPVKCNSVGYLADPNSCRDYYYCYSTFEGGYLTIPMVCPAGTNFYPNMEICVSDRVLKCNIKGSGGSNSGTEQTTATVDRSEFTCPGPGVFPVPDNSRKYYSCDLTWDGELMLKERECWENSRYSGYLQKCVDNYDWFNW